jgi:hypothetical protein
VAALAQNGDGLRADQAGAADNDDFDSFSPLSTEVPKMGSNVRMEVRKILCVVPAAIDQLFKRMQSSSSA